MAEIEKKWYVLRAISGKEAKVKEYLEADLKNSDLGEYVSQVLIPTEKVYQVRNGKKIVKERSYLPGYVLVEAALVGEVTESDEAALDRYEGFPTFYYKKEMELDIKGIRTGKIRRRKCFVYIMHEERKIGVPSLSYVSTCLQGYVSFGFDEHYLSEAQIKAVEVARYEE
jgi:hypothetical protein